MDARTIDKLITKGKGSYLFGRRSFVEVSMPIASLGSPPPPCPKLGKPAGFEGYWRSTSGAHQVMTTIHEVSSGSDPRKRKDVTTEPLFVTKETWPGGGGAHYSWWEGQRSFFKGKICRENRVKTVPVGKRIVEAYKRHREWMSKYGGHERVGITAFDAFVEAGTHARAIYTGVRGERLVMQYAVKYFYADRRKAFAKALAAAMRVSEKTGFGATLLGLPAAKGSR